MKIFTVSFKALYPVPSGLVIQCESKEECLGVIHKKFPEYVGGTQTSEITINDIQEIDYNNPIVFYESGDY